MSQAEATTLGKSPAPSRRIPFALAALVVAAILTAIGTFRGDDEHSLRTWLVVLAISVVGAAIVFWGIVPRVDRFGRGALILAVVGALSLVVFWTGLPPIFAGGAALLALAARERGAETGMASAALVLAALTVVAEAPAALVG